MKKELKIRIKSSAKSKQKSTNGFKNNKMLNSKNYWPKKNPSKIHWNYLKVFKKLIKHQNNFPRKQKIMDLCLENKNNIRQKTKQKA